MTEPSTTNKNRRSMFGTNKMNFNFPLPTQFTNIGVKKTLFIIVLVVQVSILYKWPCSQCPVQQKWTLIAIHSYWCEETIVIMLVESKFSLNGMITPPSTTNKNHGCCINKISTNADKLSAVLRFCNIFGRRYRGNCSKELPAKIHLTVDKFKSFPLQFL